MKQFGGTDGLAATIACTVLVLACLTACDDGSTPSGDTKQAAAREQLEAQLRAQQAQRLEDEKTARAAESSCNTWIMTLATAICPISLIALFVGIHIGSRALRRSHKEGRDGG